MLGSFGNTVGNRGVESFYSLQHPEAAPKKVKKQSLNQLIENEWSELPYAMMRITAARRPWDGKRLYWRDRNVQLGDIDLNLIRSRTQDDVSTYTASYTQEELRRSFALHPSLEDDELRWSAPGICDASLTTVQLAEKLLIKLVTFYTTGLSAPTSTASPSPSS